MFMANGSLHKWTTYSCEVKFPFWGSLIYHVYKCIIQVIILLDCTHSWNDAWVEKDEQKWYIALLAVSIGCYIAAYTVSGILFIWFNPAGYDCGLNVFFLSMTNDNDSCFCVCSCCFTSSGIDLSDTHTKEWYQVQAVLRVSLGNFLFFGILALIMIGVKDQNDRRDSWHHGGWTVKMVIWLLLLILMFFLPDPVILVYGFISNFGATHAPSSLLCVSETDLGVRVPTSISQGRRW